uniref:E1B-102R n=1 Tax=Human adenovirus F serotype 40 TaxID=28284 RepID=G3FJH9_ADE40|nr:E1B-102R [Human adenovirus 40]
MERPNSSVAGLYSGLHGNGSVENLATEEEGLRLLAGAASARFGSSAGRGGGGGEPEGRPGPFNGIVTEPDPEEATLNVTEQLRTDHQMMSCLRTDYESSDED